MRKSHFLFLALIALFGSGIASCSSGSSGSSEGSGDVSDGVYRNSVSGTITMQFQNDSAQSSLSAVRSHATDGSSSEPTYYGMKIISAYLVEDIDPETESNVGVTFMFYLNEDCEEDIMHCDISGGTAEDGNPIDKIIGTENYFDLSDPDGTNAALNEQTRPMDTTGSFQYVRMEFCKYDQSTPNIAWEYPGVPLRTYHRQACAVSSSKITPPLEISSLTSAVTFVASYELSGSITTGPEATGDDCAEDTEGTRVCFTAPPFVPSLIVE